MALHQYVPTKKKLLSCEMLTNEFNSLQNHHCHMAWHFSLADHPLQHTEIWISCGCDRAAMSTSCYGKKECHALAAGNPRQPLATETHAIQVLHINSHIIPHINSHTIQHIIQRINSLIIQHIIQHQIQHIIPHIKRRVVAR